MPSGLHSESKTCKSFAVSADQRPGSALLSRLVPQLISLFPLSPQYKLEKGRLFIASHKEKKKKKRQSRPQILKLWNQLWVRFPIPFRTRSKRVKQIKIKQDPPGPCWDLYTFGRHCSLSEIHSCCLVLQNRTRVARWHFSICRITPKRNPFGEVGQGGYSGPRDYFLDKEQTSNCWQPVISQRRLYGFMNCESKNTENDIHKQKYFMFSTTANTYRNIHSWETPFLYILKSLLWNTSATEGTFNTIYSRI